MAEMLEFYDVKEKKKFKTSKYKVVTRMVKGNKRRFAVAKSPYNKIDSWRVLAKK